MMLFKPTCSLVLILLVAGCSLAHADTQVGPFEGGSALDMLNSKQFRKAPGENPDDPSAPDRPIAMTCTDPKGARFKKSDAGYEECLHKTQVAR